MRKSLIFEAIMVLILIALLAAMYAMVAGGPKGGGWTVSGVIAAPGNPYAMSLSQAVNMFPGDANTLITADGKKLYAIGSNGSVLWSLDLPDKYMVQEAAGSSEVSLARSGDLLVAKDVAIYRGNVYVILVPEIPAALSGVLMAISGDGRALWNVSFPRSGSFRTAYDLSGFGALSSVAASRDVIYVYAADGRLTLVDLDGAVIKTIDNVQAAPSIDEEGNIYAVHGTYAFLRNLSDPWGSFEDYTVDAYDQNGMLKWQRTFDELELNTSLLIANIGYQQPVCHNGSLFIWSNDGVVVLDPEGNKKWARYVGDAFVMGYGFDENDTLYLSYYKTETGLPEISATGLMALAPDGTVISDLFASDIRYGLAGKQSCPKGICYLDSTVYSPENATVDAAAQRFSSDYQVIDYLVRNNGRWDVPLSINDIGTTVVSAYDLKTGARLWQHNLSMGRSEAVLTRDNIRALTFDKYYVEGTNVMSPGSWYLYNNIPQGAKGVKAMAMNHLLIANDTIYVTAWSYNYEVPAFYNDSRCVYGGGVYALDLNGTLLWSRPMDARVVGVQERNGTVFIGSGDGKVSGVTAGIVGGILAASSYLFFRFFLFGAVSRARARLDRNGNRNRVLQYIKENPGASMFEMSRSLGMNLGTVRYHLVILGMNHRITPFRADEKYVRYFTNSSSYGPEDQLIISLMRREPLRKILNALREKPGLSNMELSRELDAHESSTLRNVKLLTEKGIVVKSLLQDGKIAYSLNCEYVVHAASALVLLNK